LEWLLWEKNQVCGEQIWIEYMSPLGMFGELWMEQGKMKREGRQFVKVNERTFEKYWLFIYLVNICGSLVTEMIFNRVFVHYVYDIDKKCDLTYGLNKLNNWMVIIREIKSVNWS
jgi:hypothetical protein